MRKIIIGFVFGVVVALSAPAVAQLGYFEALNVRDAVRSLAQKVAALEGRVAALETKQ